MLRSDKKVIQSNSSSGENQLKLNGQVGLGAGNIRYKVLKTVPE